MKLRSSSLFSRNVLVVLCTCRKIVRLQSSTNHSDHFRFSVLNLSKILVLLGRVEPFPSKSLARKTLTTCQDVVFKRCHATLVVKMLIFHVFLSERTHVNSQVSFACCHDNNQQSFAFQQYSELIQSILSQRYVRDRSRRNGKRSSH